MMPRRSPRRSASLAVFRLALAIAVGGAALAAVARAEGLDASVGAVPITADAAAMRALPVKEQTARAFAAAFGGGARIAFASGEPLIYEPGALVWTSTGAVLVSSGFVERAGPDDLGAIAVHYLIPEGTTFRVVGAHPKGIEGGLAGGPPQWVVSTDFGDEPVVVTDSFDWRRGVTCATTALYGLGGGAPSPLAVFPSGYDDVGAGGEREKAVSVSGSIRNVLKGHSFEVHFRGTSDFTQVFTRVGERYVKTASDGEPPPCRSSETAPDPAGSDRPKSSDRASGGG